MLQNKRITLVCVTLQRVQSATKLDRIIIREKSPCSSVDKSKTQTHTHTRRQWRKLEIHTTLAMEAVQFSTVASSRQFSAASHSHSFSSLTRGQNQARKPPSSKLWTGSTTNSTTSLSSRNLFSVSQKQKQSTIPFSLYQFQELVFPEKWLHIFGFFLDRERYGVG